MATKKFDIPKSLQKGMKEAIIANTRANTEFYDVSQPYDVLDELRVRVTPQLEEVDFYGGYRTPDYEYAPVTSNEIRKLDKQRKKKKRRLVDMGNVLRDFEAGQITITGPAGSGKTTLLKQISRDVLEGEYLKGIEIVQFIEGRDLYSLGENVSAGELMLCNLGEAITEQDRTEFIQFVEANPDKILFVIDSLDTLPNPLTGKHNRVGIHERASPTAILWNLLTGALIPGCRIITSSREHAIRDYRGNLRADKVIAMVGLTEEKIEQIVCGYVGEEEGIQTMEYLKSESPSLMSLCSTPVFLVFTLIGMKSKSGFTPSTMSGIMVSLIQSLIRSPHARVPNVQEVLGNLEHLSFVGTKEYRVLFTTGELELYHLLPDEVTDLAIISPGRNIKIMESHQNLLFFCHQSIQETMTALYIAKMSLDEFKSYISGNIHAPQNAVIRRILCGIMLDDAVLKYTEQDVDESFRAKQDFLKQSLRVQLDGVKYDCDLLELYISIHEARSGMCDVIKEKVKSIVLHRIPLSTSDVHAVGYVASQCNRLEMLMLMNCNLNPSSLRSLELRLQDSNLEINSLIIGENENIGEKGMRSIGIMVNKCKVRELDVQSCCLSAKHMQAFRDSVGKTKITTLHVNHNENLGIEGTGIVAEVVRECSVDELTMQECQWTSEHVKKFLEHIGECQISTMDLSRNHDLGVDGLKLVAQMVKRCKVRALSLRFCKLTSENLDAFNEAAMGTKITSFEFGGNTSLAMQGILSIGKITRSCGIEELDIACDIFTPEQWKALNTALKNTKIRLLNLSHSLAKRLKAFEVFERFSMDFKVEKKNPRPFEVHTICDLLLDVTEEVWLDEWEIKDENRDLLQQTLDLICLPNLKVITDSDDILNTTREPDPAEGLNKRLKIIGPEGGSIEVEGCRVSFPSGALDKYTCIKLSPCVNTDFWPEGLTGITPMLTCLPSMKFNVAVKIQLPTWCSASTDDVMAQVMSQDDSQSLWVEHTTTHMPMNMAERVIEFESEHFTRFLAYFTDIWKWMFRHHLSVGLYYQASGNFSVLFHVHNDTVKKECIDDLQHRGFTPAPIMLNEVHPVKGETVAVTLHCEMNRVGLDFKPNETLNLEVDEAFARSLRRYLTCTIDPLPPAGSQLHMVCEIDSEGKVEESEFNMNWPGNQAPDPPAPRIVFQGDVIAENFVIAND